MSVKQGAPQVRLFVPVGPTACSPRTAQFSDEEANVLKLTEIQLREGMRVWFSKSGSHRACVVAVLQKMCRKEIKPRTFFLCSDALV